MITSIKNKRGFSLVELVISIGIIAALSSIAIPTYTRYKKEARRTAYRLDLTELYTAMSAFGLEGDYCDSGGVKFSLENVGFESLAPTTSPTDEPSKYEAGGKAGANGFIGFGKEDCTGVIPAVTTPVHHMFVSAGSTKKDLQCILDESKFTAGVVGNVSASEVGAWSVNQKKKITEVISDSTDYDDAC